MTIIYYLSKMVMFILYYLYSNIILMKPQTPELLLEEKQLREQLYARYYLGMRVSEIAVAEDVDPSRVRDSIRRGLKQLAKYF